jgi:hypothetical protein
MAWGIGPVSLLEFLWAVFGLAGALNVWFIVLASWGDKQYLKRTGKNGIRKAVAEMSFETDCLFLGILLGFAIVGIVAMTQESTQQPSSAPRLTAWVLTVVFFAISIAINIVAVRRRLTREYVNDIETQRQGVEL